MYTLSQSHRYGIIIIAYLRCFLRFLERTSDGDRVGQREKAAERYGGQEEAWEKNRVRVREKARERKRKRIIKYGL